MKKSLSTIFGIAWSIFVLPAAAFAGPNAGAQNAVADSFIGDRFLFIFDTSDEMKSRVKEVQTEINGLLATSMAGELHEGDSIGVWTFNQKLHTGEFPLLDWQPQNAARTAKTINQFVEKQSYNGKTDFSVLQPMLKQVMRSSPKLTVLIFCDGEGSVGWTPYDKGINDVFKTRWEEQKNSHQPFVLVARTQFGKYDGCTVNFPPGMVNFPVFVEAPPSGSSNKPPQQPVTPPATNHAAVEKAEPPVVRILDLTNIVTVLKTNVVVTEVSAPAPAAAATNSSIPVEDGKPQTGPMAARTTIPRLAVYGAGLFLAGAALTALVIRRRRPGALL